MKQTYFTSKSLIIFFIFITCSFSSLAQDDTINDPLKKPEIWSKITKDYQNIALWEAYFETKWEDLDVDIQEQIMKWQNILAIEMIAKEEAIFDTKTEEVSWEIPEENLVASNAEENFREEELRVEAIKYNQQVEEIIQQQTSELTFLKENVKENFLIIEDILFEEFINYGAEYTYYDDVHPDRKYSLEKWVDEKTKELQNLKREAFGVIKLEVNNSSY